MKMLSIIIPAYNEAPTLRLLAERILEVSFPVDYEIVIVNDHSHDQTRQIAESLKKEGDGKIQVIHNDVNRGKGYSIQRGFACARGDYVIIQDADFEYDPRDLPRLAEVILKGEADIAFGSRFMKATHPAGMAYPNKIANRLLTAFTNMLYGAKLTDVYSCYKMIPTDLIRSFDLKHSGFESEAEILAKLLRLRKRILEIPVSYQGRTVKEGKKIKAVDFFLALGVLLKLRSG